MRLFALRTGTASPRFARSLAIAAEARSDFIGGKTSIWAALATHNMESMTNASFRHDFTISAYTARRHGFAAGRGAEPVCSYSMRTIEKWKWRICWAGRATTTRVHFTEAQIRAQHPDAARVDASRIVVQLPETEADRDAATKQRDGRCRSSSAAGLRKTRVGQPGLTVS